MLFRSKGALNQGSLFNTTNESWDEYDKDVNRLDVKTAKLQEYKDFLKKIKDFGFKKSVSFNFKELHIEQ